MVRLSVISISTLLISFLALLGSSSGSHNHNPAAPNVSVDVYYESLCKYSANFITNYLVKLFEGGLLDVVDLNLVPYGNAHTAPNGAIICQHGPKECFLNTIQACAIHNWPDPRKHFPFIHCIESQVHNHRNTRWKLCASKLGLDSNLLTICYASGFGKELELKYADETHSLQPPHQYLPWVVVDGQPLYKDYKNIVNHICEAFRGMEAPTACRIPPLITSVLQGKSADNSIHPVSFATETSTFLAGISSALFSWMP